MECHLRRQLEQGVSSIAEKPAYLNFFIASREQRRRQLASLASPGMFPQLDVCTASMVYFPSLAAFKIPTILWLTAPAAREAEVESSFCTV
jgi:hypothetical protein